MKSKVISVALVALVALAGCASTDNAASPAPSTSTSASAVAVATEKASPKASPTPTPTPTKKTPQIGEVATHGGIQIVVTSAVASPTVPMNTSGYRAGSGYETYEDVPAQTGGRYIIVNAVVTNNAKGPLDLTCGYPIDIKVFNLNAQVYSPIQDSYKIKGNPECNAQLQPGFESPMTWAYLVPAKSSIIGLAFSEVDFSSSGRKDPTVIGFGPGI